MTSSKAPETNRFDLTNLRGLPPGTSLVSLHVARKSKADSRVSVRIEATVKRRTVYLGTIKMGRDSWLNVVGPALHGYITGCRITCNIHEREWMTVDKTQ